MSISNPISFIVKNQLPEFIRDDLDNKYENFVAFIKAYYEWLEEENGVTAESRSLLSYADIDKTTSEFIQYFSKKFLPYFPEDLVNDKAKLIKTINDFYAKKGSIESLKFLFRILYNEDIEIVLPKENILRASDGKWRIPRTLRLTVENTPSSFDLNSIVKRLAVGQLSKASCVIEGAYRTIDVGTGAEIIEIYVSNVRKTFENGELLDVTYVDDNGEQGILLSERIIGALSNVRIDPKHRGLKYKTGDPVVLIGGLSDNPAISTAEARVVVNEVTDGRIQTVAVSKGGFGFRIKPNTEVDVIPSAIDIARGDIVDAVVEVTEVTNTIPFTYNLDSIDQYASIQLNAASYGFPNLTTANIATVLSEAFEFETVNIGAISKVKIRSPGSKYTEVPTIDVNSFYDTTTSENYFNDIFFAGEDTPANRTAWEASRQSFLNLGIIANVQIVTGGTGYNTSTDKIYVNRNAGGGYGANITFTVDGTGKITSLTLVSGGEGYIGPKGSVELVVRNKNNVYASAAGTGASLIAYRYGEGDEIVSTVEDVGRIKNFRLLSRGSGYVDTPIVSLKVRDIEIAAIDDPIDTFVEKQMVYQGNLSSPTFRANVDQYISSSGVLRVYNYNGSLNTSANLTITATDSSPQYNVDIISEINYGNGLARANAEFLNGLIIYNGYYLNTDGFLSSDKKLQDSRKYHNFSYVIVTEQSLNNYKQALLDILHPIGMKPLGTKKIIDVVTTGFTFS
jgi:hypothetical protein